MIPDAEMVSKNVLFLGLNRKIVWIIDNIKEAADALATIPRRDASRRGSTT